MTTPKPTQAAMSDYTRTRDEMALAERVARADFIIKAFAIAYAKAMLEGEPSEALRRVGRRATNYAYRYGLIARRLDAQKGKR